MYVKIKNIYGRKKKKNFFFNLSTLKFSVFGIVAVGVVKVTTQYSFLYFNRKLLFSFNLKIVFLKCRKTLFFLVVSKTIKSIWKTKCFCCYRISVNLKKNGLDFKIYRLQLQKKISTFYRVIAHERPIEKPLKLPDIFHVTISNCEPAHPRIIAPLAGSGDFFTAAPEPCPP